MSGDGDKLRAVFMGSPEFAVPSLHAVHEECDLRAVVCQPDRPAGRGRKLTPPAVKVAAEALGLPVLAPHKMKDGTLRAALAEHAPQVIVVVAFGRILPPDILALPEYGCINVHGSLLPRWRGAAPIQRAVLAGDAVTGVAIMAMDEGLDTGAVYRMVETPIGPTETSGELFARLSGLGANALAEFLSVFPDVDPPTPQSTDGVTHAPMLEKAEGRVDWERPARVVAAHIRGMDPWPGAVTTHGDAPLKLFGAIATEGHGAPGTLLQIGPDTVTIACLDGAVAISEAQPAGKKRMPAPAWATGRRLSPGTTLGT